MYLEGCAAAVLLLDMLPPISFPSSEEAIKQTEQHLSKYCLDRNKPSDAQCAIPSL